VPWIEKHLEKDQMDVLRSIKKHFDPNEIMNPVKFCKISVQQPNIKKNYMNPG